MEAEERLEKKRKSSLKNLEKLHHDFVDQIDCLKANVEEVFSQMCEKENACEDALQNILDNLDDILIDLKDNSDESELKINRTDDDNIMWQSVDYFREQKKTLQSRFNPLQKEFRQIERKFRWGIKLAEEKDKRKTVFKDCLQETFFGVKELRNEIFAEIQKCYTSESNFSEFDLLKRELESIRKTVEDLLKQLSYKYEDAVDNFVVSDEKDSEKDSIKTFNDEAGDFKIKLTAQQSKMRKLLQNHNVTFQSQMQEKIMSTTAVLQEVEQIHQERCQSLNSQQGKLEELGQLIERDENNSILFQVDNLKYRLREIEKSLINHCENAKLRIERLEDVIDQRECITKYRIDLRTLDSETHEIQTAFLNLTNIHQTQMTSVQQKNEKRIIESKQKMIKWKDETKQTAEDLDQIISNYISDAETENEKGILSEEKDNIQKQINCINQLFDDAISKLTEDKDFEMFDKIESEFHDELRVANAKLKDLEQNVNTLKMSHLNNRLQIKQAFLKDLNTLIERHQKETVIPASNLMDYLKNVSSNEENKKSKEQRVENIKNALSLALDNLKTIFDTATEKMNNTNSKFDKVYEDMTLLIENEINKIDTTMKEAKKLITKIVEEKSLSHKSEQKKIKHLLKKEMLETKQLCSYLMDKVESISSQSVNEKDKKQLTKLNNALKEYIDKIAEFCLEMKQTILTTDQADFSIRNILSGINKQKRLFESKLNAIYIELQEICERFEEDLSKILQCFRDKNRNCAINLQQTLTKKISTVDCDELKDELQSILQEVEVCIVEAESSFTQANLQIDQSKTDDTFRSNDILSEFQNQIKILDKRIEDATEQLQLVSDKYSNNNPIIQTKVQEVYDNLDSTSSKLLGNMDKILDGNNEADYVDINEMCVKVKEIKVKLESVIIETNAKFDEEKRNIEATDELHLLYECFLRFDKFSDNQTSLTNILNSEFEEITKSYKISDSAVLARKIRGLAIEDNLLLSEENNLKIYKLPVTEMTLIQEVKIRRFELGRSSHTKEHRHVMLAGMTGSGKSLLINNMVNYIYGVTHKDNFRFKLVVESDEKQERDEGAGASEAYSMTSWVTAYTLQWQEGFLIPYSLTIVDTPGFGDTRGLKYDENIFDQIKKYFNNGQLCPNQEITSIGFLIQASQARLTQEQEYIFNQILNIYGKDMKENIFIIFTFADPQNPPAMEVVKSNKIPYGQDCTFKFNNSAVYASRDDVLARLAWDFGRETLQEYFHAVRVIQPISLKLTKQVLDEREQLRLILGSLQDQIFNGMELLRSIEEHSNTIVNLEGTIKANKDFKIKKPTFQCEMKKVGYYITNCSVCNVTCHEPCAIRGFHKQGCVAMDKGYCLMCPAKCSYDMHTNGNQVYIYTAVEQEETIEEMMKYYNVAMTEKGAKKKLLMGMLSRYAGQRTEIFECVLKAKECVNRLEEISLRCSFLTNSQYIENLIDSERRSSRPFKTDRLRHLHHLKNMAKTLEDVKGKHDNLPGQVSDYEANIATKIQSIEDNLEEDETRDSAEGNMDIDEDPASLDDWKSIKGVLKSKKS